MVPVNHVRAATHTQQAKQHLQQQRRAAAGIPGYCTLLTLARRRFSGQSREIASLIVWLLSEQAAWVSGQVKGIDGGLSSIRGK